MEIVNKISEIYRQFGADDYVVQFFTIFTIMSLTFIIITSFITVMTRIIR